MDAFDFGNVKAEKARATLRYNLLTSIAKTFRIVELCLALLLLSWIVTRLPFVVQISGDYIRKVSGFIGSPLFVFMISNAIIATLMVKSSRISGQHFSSDNAGADLCEELLKNNAERRESPLEGDTLPSVAEEVEYQDKQIISEMNVTSRLERKFTWLVLVQSFLNVFLFLLHKPIQVSASNLTGHVTLKVPCQLFR